MVKSKIIFKITSVVFLSALFFAAIPAVQANHETYRNSSHGPRFYFGGMGMINSMGGTDFDGDTYLIGDTEALFVPKVEGSLGFGALLGLRFNNSAALELNYIRSEHDSSHSDAIADANIGNTTFQMINFDVKVFLAPNNPVQPYLLLGFGIPWLDVERGAEGLVPPYYLGDATYTGTGLNLGGGLAVALSPNLALNAGITYRWIEYDTAEGIDLSGEIEDPLKSNVLSLNVGLIFTP